MRKYKIEFQHQKTTITAYYLNIYTNLLKHKIYKFYSVHQLLKNKYSIIVLIYFQMYILTTIMLLQ